MSLYTIRRDGEDDLFKRRKAPFPLNIDNSKSSMSALSSQTSAATAAQDARLLSKANDQATIAARSILMSGGTEETAVKTAGAAAEAVLQAHYVSESVTIGPKEWFVKRKIKKQAEVIGSMALVVAVNSVKGIDYSPKTRHDTRSTERSDRVTSSIITNLDTSFGKRSKNLLLKPRFINLSVFKDTLFGNRKTNSRINEQESKNSDKSSKRSTFSRKSKASKNSKEERSNILNTVAIHIENSGESSNDSSKSKKKPQGSLLLLGSENEEHIYTINQQDPSKASSTSVETGYMAKVENIISSESEASTSGQTTTDSTLNVTESSHACTANPFEFFTFCGNSKQEVGIIPEQDHQSVANSFSVKSEIIEHQNDWLENKSSSDLDYGDAALSSDRDSDLSSDGESLPKRRARQGRDDPSYAYDDRTNFSSESRDEVDQSGSSSSSSSSASSSESESQDETTYTELKQRIRKASRRQRDRDVEIQSVYLNRPI